MDAFWTAVAAVLGAVAASAITGWVTYKVTKHQVAMEKTRVDADSRARSERLEFDTAEARKSRIAEARAAWALPLREAIAQWLAIGDIGVFQIALTEALSKQSENSVIQGFALAQAVQIFQKQAEVVSKISALKYQVSDVELLDLLDELELKWQRHSVENKEEIQKVFEAMSDMPSFLDASDEYRKFTSGFRDIVIRSNMRLELLLAVEDKAG